MIEFDPTQLVLGRGELYFESFLPNTRTGTGERYIGNTISFMVLREVERVERYTSFKGQKTLRESPIVSEKHSIQFITDNISLDNIGLFYGNGQSTTKLGAGADVTESFVANRGRFFQLGKSIRPSGVNGVLDISVKKNNATINIDSNFEIDYDMGRVFVKKDAPDIGDNTAISVKFSWRVNYSENVTSVPLDVHGSMRFVSKNVVGLRRNFFYPLVRISPRGGVDLKGDQWQQIPFDVSAMRAGPNVEVVYVDALTAIGNTLDEQAIIDYGGISLDEFPALENELDQIINFSMPAADYGQPIP